SSRRRHTRFSRDWSSDVCSSDLGGDGSGRPRRSIVEVAHVVDPRAGRGAGPWLPRPWARRAASFPAMGHRTEEILRVGGVDELVDRGLAADEDGDVELAERILDEAGGRMGENHPRVLHLAGRVAWAHGDIERATGFLQQATDQDPKRADIHIDCARCLHLMGDDGLAEEQVRAALALPELDASSEGDARVLLSRIRLEDDDPDEALEVLEGVPEALKEQALYLSALADVLVELQRTDEALDLLARAVAAEPGDPDYHYQRGLTQQATGDLEGGTASMVRVLPLETELRGTSSAPTFQEV